MASGCKISNTNGQLIKLFVLSLNVGERPFICDHEGCIQSFAEHSSLRKHKLTHTGKYLEKYQKP